MRLIARYAKDLGESFELITVYDGKRETEQISKTHLTAHTLTTKYPSAIWFERKIHDDFGIRFVGSFDTRPLVHQERFPADTYPMRKDFQTPEITPAPFKPYAYEVVQGDGVFQVSVGPIHAGIIEPGHFHFSQAGEGILHQEVRHFYTYRGIEKMLEGKSLSEAKPLIERISGNASIAYQIALRDIWCASAQTKLPRSLQKYHALLLEIERVIHHWTDLGFIPNDAGFAAALAYGSRVAEEARRMLKVLTGHRFGFGAVGLDGGRVPAEELKAWLDTLEEETGYFENWITGIPSLWDRFDTTGILSHEAAKKYGVVGVVARASGVMNDSRETAFYLEHGFRPVIQERGDVAARFKVRITEVKNAVTMMRHFLEPEIASVVAGEPVDGSYSTLVESAIGELYMEIDIAQGCIARFFVRDPSFVNWQALHLMMPGNIIADFPLINKSCDLSYAGNDL